MLWGSAQSEQIPFGTMSSMASCVAINSQDDIFLGTYYSEGVYRSTDNGQIWTKVKPHASVTDVWSIVFHPSGCIIVGTDGGNSDARGVFVSTDNGDTYVKMSSGLAAGKVKTVAVGVNGYVYAAVGKDVYCSTDTCKNWVIKSTGLTGTVPVDQIACAPNGNLFLYKSKYIFRSTDNGNYWTAMTQGWVEDSIWDMLISRKGHIFYATNQNYIYQSVDNGDSWGRVHNGLSVYNGKVTTLGEDPQGNLYAGSQGADLVANVHRSTDDGGHWTLLGTAQCANVLANITFDSDGTCYASCGGWLFRTKEGTLGLDEQIITDTPEHYGLSQNYPNPFNPTTGIQFTVGSGQLTVHTTLKIHNILGQEVATLVNEEKEPGFYTVTWDASEMASGVYFYRLQAGDFSETRRMVLMQ